MQINTERKNSSPIERSPIINNSSIQNPLRLNISHIENTVDELSTPQGSSRQLSALRQLDVTNLTREYTNAITIAESSSPEPLISPLVDNPIGEVHSNSRVNHESLKEKIFRLGNNAVIEVSRFGNNMATIGTRNFRSVAIGTVIREIMMCDTISQYFTDHVSHETREVISCGIILIPLTLQFLGLIRDCCTGRLNKTVFFARLSNILYVSTTAMILWYSGNLANATLPQISGLIYVLYRDITQFLYPLSDNTSGDISFTNVLISSVAYVGIQTLVNYGMKACSNDAVGPYLGISGRAVINLGGETTDESIYRTLNSRGERNPPLVVRMGSCQNRAREAVLNQTLNTLASRAAIISSAYSVSKALPSDHPFASEIVGGVMGGAYPGFIYAHNQTKTEPTSGDIEMVEVTAEENREEHENIQENENQLRIRRNTIS